MPGSESRFRDAPRLSAAWSEANFIDGEEVLVAEVDGHVVGVVTVERRTAEFELVDIDVERSYQGQGIGKMVACHGVCHHSRGGERVDQIDWSGRPRDAHAKGPRLGTRSKWKNEEDALYKESAAAGI